MDEKPVAILSGRIEIQLALESFPGRLALDCLLDLDAAAGGLGRLLGKPPMAHGDDRIPVRRAEKRLQGVPVAVAGLPFADVFLESSGAGTACQKRLVVLPDLDELPPLLRDELFLQAFQDGNNFDRLTGDRYDRLCG